MMFRMASSPHVHSASLTTKVMLWVIIAMIPAIIVQLYYFGFGTLIQIALAVSFAVCLEWSVTKLRGRDNLTDISDFSVVLTALILAVAIPPYAPYWLILLGIFCAVILGKQVYGGLGQNPFNPAMIGYAILLISFPVQMTAWALPNHLLLEPTGFRDAYLLIFQGVSSDGYSLSQLTSTIDAVTQATPLDSVKTGVKNHLALTAITTSPIFQHDDWQQNLTVPMGIGWWQINLAFLFGGLLLIGKKVIHWQIPVALLITFTLLCSITWLIAPETFPSPLWQLFSGATMFGAFFIATDPVTASITPKGKVYFGMLIGILLYVIRFYGGYPDGVAFAVLLGNICVPLIDHYTRPRLYGR